MVSDFSLPVSLVVLSLLINHWRGSSSKHWCVNKPPLSSILNVSQSSEGAVRRGSSPKRAKDTTQQLFWARGQCSSRRGRGRGRGRTCSPYPLHPVGPLVFIGTDTKRPLRRHQHRHTRRHSQNMLPHSAGRLDGAISEVLLGDLWPIGNSEGRVRTGGNVECGGKREFINMLESSLRLFRPPYNPILAQ